MSADFSPRGMVSFKLAYYPAHIRSLPRNSIDDMTRRDVAFLLIGIGLGGLLAAVAAMPYFAGTSSATLWLFAGLVPLAALVAGLVLQAYRTKTRISD